jgi:hypothetical protein
VVVERVPGVDVRERRFIRIDGLSPATRIGVHNASLVNLERAVLERVFYVQGPGGFVPVPQPRVPFTLPEFTTNVVSRCGIVTPISEQDFVNCYKARKRTVYQMAMDSLAVTELERKDAYLAAFVKYEKLNFSAKADPTPRLIQPRQPRFNLCVGRFIKPLERRLYRAIDRTFGSRTVMKGLNYVERANCLRRKWDKFHAPCGIRADAKRFDQHVSVEALRWEHSVYKRCIPRADRATLSRWLEWQVHNRGFGRVRNGFVKYRVDGRRASGDMNTACGNVLIMCGLVYQFVLHLGIKAELADDGDDFILIVESADAPRVLAAFDQFFLDYGFEMEVADPCYRFEELILCQTSPVWDGQGWVMVRCPAVGVAKDTTCLVTIDSSKNLKRWMAGVGEGGMSLAGGIPIYDALYRRYSAEGEGYRPLEHLALDSGFYLQALLMKDDSRRDRPVTDTARISFWQSFDIEPAVQEILEAHYRSARIEWPLVQVDARPRDAAAAPVGAPPELL